MHCQHCDAVLPADVSFCPQCGVRVPTVVGSSAGHPTVNLPAGGFQLPPAVVTSTPAQPYSDIPQAALPAAIYPVVLPNSNAAVVSLIFGILSWVLLPLIGAIVAIVAGHMARREIRDSGGRVGGSGMAMAGLILGYLHVALLVVGGCLALAFITIVSSGMSG